MPKLIDRDNRVETVYPVVCRIVASEGVPAATVRRVAAETDLSVNAVRHMWPSQDRLHLRVVQWLTRQATDDLPYWDPERDPLEHLRLVLRGLVPSDDGQRMRAQALLAYGRAAQHDGVIGEVIRRHQRQVTGLLRDQLERYLRLTQPGRPGRALRAADITAADPNHVDAPSLLLLVLVEGLTQLVCDHELPLDLGRAAGWLNQIEACHLDWPT